MLLKKRVIANGSTPVVVLEKLFQTEAPKNEDEIEDVYDFMLYVGDNYPNK